MKKRSRGGIGFERLSDTHGRTAKIGYWLGEEYWGRGLATQALKRASHYALQDFNFIRIEALADRIAVNKKVRKGHTMSIHPNPELGFYMLAGQPESPRELIAELHDAEALGFGTAFISERYHSKEAATLSGAAGAVTSSIRIATAATNHNTRHPLVTAGYALTMHSLTGGRFILGLGRGIEPMQKAFGIPPITTAQMEDFVGLMRRVLAGEMVVGYDGPVGAYPVLRLGSDVKATVPMLLVAFGPNSLALGGRCFDEVVLHTYFTDETTARCVQTVKQAAEQAGRNPDDVKVWSCFATLGDHLPEEKRLMKSVGRMATYLQGYGDLLVRTNRWDPKVLESFRSDAVVQSFQGGIDSLASTEELEHISSLIPESWLSCSATGSPQKCADAIRGQLDLGCDGVILHGASPSELTPIVEQYRK